MRSLYRAMYVSIFLYFLRLLAAKFIVGRSDVYSIYLDGVTRQNTEFDVHVASSANMSLLLTIKDRLFEARWYPTIRHADKPRERASYDLDDPIVAEYLNREEISEIRESMRGIGQAHLILHQKDAR